MRILQRDCREGGFSLLEVIITMAILAVGLLGLAGLQARAINAEAESFARGQAVMLATEMADRMYANISELKLSSVTASSGYNQQDAGGTKVVFGTSYNNDCITVANDTAAEQATCCAAKATIAARDLCEWDLSLKGIGESVGGGKVGGMNGARGCVFNTGTTREFEVDVVWNGRDIGVIGSGNSCGSTAITTRRSGISRLIRYADLDGT